MQQGESVRPKLWRGGMKFLAALIVAVSAALSGVWLQNWLTSRPEFQVRVASDKSLSRVFLICRNVGSSHAESICIAIRPLEPALGAIVSPVFDLSPKKGNRENVAAWEITGYRHLFGLTKRMMAQKTIPELRTTISFFRSMGTGSREELETYNVPAIVEMIQPDLIRIINHNLPSSKSPKRIRLECMRPGVLYAIHVE